MSRKTQCDLPTTISQSHRIVPNVMFHFPHHHPPHIIWELVRSAILKLLSRPHESEILGMGPAGYIFTSPPGDPDICLSEKLCFHLSAITFPLICSTVATFLPGLHDSLFSVTAFQVFPPQNLCHCQSLFLERSFLRSLQGVAVLLLYVNTDVFQGFPENLV